jgi:hypothetical protein
MTLQGGQPLQPQDLTPEQKRLDLVWEWLNRFGAISGKAITPQLAAVYVEALKDVEDRRLVAGFEECLRTATHWPWPAEIRDASELG